ncbi:hypothetical protein PIB30_042862 [Stylosanthes scabra]|uniref:Uncharacterized protein n=1 Tax=Stylosanthes scabra TaxID=79078 RepID=A0ABU6YFT7_9FABA|nr:hypothetical protein [Stylosanthes scabra]
MPVDRWFENDAKREAYDEQLSRMEILPPKYIGEKVLSEEKYSEFWRFIDIQGLQSFLFMCERYDPHLVVTAYTTISIQGNLNDGGKGSFLFGFKLRGRKYQFLLSTLAAA